MLRRLLERLPGNVPSQCSVCRAWPAQPVCEACVARFAQPRPRCVRCALLVAAGVRECGRCIASPSPLDACHAALDYDFPWSSLIAQFKFEGQAGWARAFATLMRSAPWIEAAVEQADIVVPLPLSQARLAQRGYNQALLLARALAPDKADAGLLLRWRDTAEQASLSRQERMRNVAGAFTADPMRASELRGKRVALVDDVMTSGASMHAAALALRQAGAAAVTGLVLARTDEPG